MQYNPQNAGAPAPAAAPYAAQNYPPPPAGPPPVVNNFDAYASGANPYAPRGPENVSAAPNPVFGNPFTPATPNDQHHAQDGMSSSRNMRHNVREDVICTVQIANKNINRYKPGHSCSDPTIHQYTTAFNNNPAKSTCSCSRSYLDHGSSAYLSSSGRNTATATFIST